jgi:hypothetical protein
MKPMAPIRKHPPRLSAVAMLLAGVLVCCACGCGAGVSMRVADAYQPGLHEFSDFGTFNNIPKPRLGCLPYPGAFTLYGVADPERLGHHAYDKQFGASEKSDGIIYTTRGGFIDLAHTRKTIDLCKYVAVRIEVALLNDWTALRFKGREPSVYTIHLNYPPAWKTLPAEKKQAIARELSIRIGQRVAMLMVSWHEILTWFGYQAMGVLPEQQSAFTWDDVGSHALGVMVGGLALRDTNREWDDAVTAHLSESLRMLGAVPPDQTSLAVQRVKGLWWRGFEPLKRQFETGLDGRPIEPWLVRDFPTATKSPPWRYELPRLNDVFGQDYSRLVRIEIKPNVFETGKIRATIPGRPSLIDVDRDLPAIMQHMRQWHITRSGEQSLRPY